MAGVAVEERKAADPVRLYNHPVRFPAVLQANPAQFRVPLQAQYRAQVPAQIQAVPQPDAVLMVQAGQFAQVIMAVGIFRITSTVFRKVFVRPIATAYLT